MKPDQIIAKFTVKLLLRKKQYDKLTICALQKNMTVDEYVNMLVMHDILNKEKA